MTKVLIIDDEPLACANLLSKINTLSQDYEVKTVVSPVKGVDLIKTWKPNILFLDISMPDLNGFEVLEQLEEGERNFALVFCTAHSEFAVKAFEEAAIDYIMKPVEPERLEKTLLKIKGLEKNSWSENGTQITTAKLEKFIGHKKNQTTVLYSDDIGFFTSKDHETIIFSDGDEYFYGLSLNSIEERISQTDFFRCHRSYLINLAHVESFNSDNSTLELRNYSREIPVSKRSRSKFLKAFKSS